jgi:class 3 adenylate cyclase/integral membrane sensor domain MASE1
MEVLKPSKEAFWEKVVTGHRIRHGPRNPHRLLYAAKVVGLAAAYYGAAKLGLSLSFETDSVTAVWPPTGIALAALVLWGYRLWPGVALGALLANTWTGIPLYAELGITLGNTLEALAGAWLLHRVAGFKPSLDRVRDVIALLVLAGFVSTAISASVGVGTLLLAGEIDVGEIPTVWRTWWLGDMMGDIVVAPALLIGVTHWPFRQAPGRPLEGALVALLLIGIGGLAFSQSTALTFLVFPPLIWAALRFWHPGAAAGSLILAGIAVTFTAHDVGPFSGRSPDEELLLAQSFVGVAGLTALLLAERERLRDLFGRHVGRDVARAVLDGDVAPEGEEREIAALFIDLVGSTSLAWERPPSQLVSLLNDFFHVVVDVVEAHGGVVNKFQGDAALCVFGAPVSRERPAADALAAGRELCSRLADEVPQSFGIGVSAGPAVAGNVGGDERFEYTVIGDPVNEAARLCELAKARPQRMLASQTAVELAGAPEDGRWALGEAVMLRGRRALTRLATTSEQTRRPGIESPPPLVGASRQ